MFNVRGDSLYYEDVRLGPSEGLYADTKELASLGKADGVHHMSMPMRVDMVFVAGNRVVGCESKTTSDLISSTSSRRLARQMRTLLSSVNVPCLIMKGGLPNFNDESKEIEEVLTNLVRLQCLGVTLLPCPRRDKALLARLVKFRTVLMDGSRSPLAAIAGTDREKKASGGLLRMIRGIGPVAENRLRETFGSTLGVLQATDQELAEAKLSATIIKRIREAAS